MLRSWRDWQSVAYLVGLPLLVLVQWQANSFNILLYGLTLILALGVSCINHNHAHLPLWKNTGLNRLTDVWVGILQGHPVFLFTPAHINSHHRHNQLPGDVTRIEQFGSHNHLVGYLLFPLYVLPPLSRLKRLYLKQVRRENPKTFFYIMLQHIALLAMWLCALVVDWKKFALYVFFPQLLSLHFLLASNYLQHAHTDIGSRYNHSRNFIGIINWLLFNVGYHTAHHEDERAHWSNLPVIHAHLNGHIQQSLNQTSLLRYVFIDLLTTPLYQRVKHRGKNA
jgi:fatty acid desaturase